MLDNVRVVLVGTTHSGNIGSAARAMKVMGFSQLVLVAPECEIDGQTIALAAGASDIANNARIVSSLEEAIADCPLVIASSARSRTLQWPQLEMREYGQKAAQECRQHSVALVFGRERTGLTNDELQKCHFHVTIPANPEYSSLNLAMAVQTLCYELRMAWLESEAFQGESQSVEYPLSDDLERFYEHLEKVLHDAQFINKQHPGQVMTKLRRLYNRARPESHELNILRGMLSSIEKTFAGMKR
uniref:tRNA (cytosine(32)/uridine(32)-2'-O)-methyltransferase TrmJ n=1 Tax=Thaumasiovibrio occultus TaxID=1891184 RepID=UPI000B35D2C5|nr:tRNA (cytosine(32)/uridine(32)-2'-O)-methyltransferase TrmJ [Thaumasiovibrio occultus]